MEVDSCCEGEEVFDLALQRGKWCFTKDAFPALSWGFRLTCLPDLIAAVFRRQVRSDLDLYVATPASAKDLFSKTACIFSKAFIASLKRRFSAFDSLWNVADGFISTESHGTWTNVIVENTLLYYYFKAREKLYPQGPPWLEEPDTTSRSDAGTGGSLPPAPISQISLKGSTLKQAWAESNDSRKITGFEGLPLRDWIPSTPGEAPVFLGTAHHPRGVWYQRALDNAFSCNPSRIAGVQRKTQLSPLSSVFACIYTSFSALRSFLWPVFVGEVIDAPPGPSGALEEPFRIRNEAYRDVVLVVFHPNQPAPTGIPWYQVPPGKEEAWNTALLSTAPSSTFWIPTVWTESLKAIHGQDTSELPGVIHGRDLSSLRKRLSGFPCHRGLLWKSAWTSDKAARGINSDICHLVREV